MTQYLQFNFTTTNQEQTDTLVAILSNVNFEGFEETAEYLKAFILINLLQEETLDEVIAIFPLIQYSKTTVENINWNKQWEENFEPVIVDDFVAIRAHFHQPINTVKHDLIITPKMSFGTGHHSTTLMMMEAMRDINFNNKSVLDFGTGTGVLAILAKKLNAATVMAIDNDEWSIENAKENFLKNGVIGVDLLQKDNVEFSTTYDVILANINLNIILNSLTAIAIAINPLGTLLLSGFLKNDENAIKTALDINNFKYINTYQNKEWICIKAAKNAPY